MRTNQRCPKCQGTKLYVCENRQPNPRYSNSVLNFHITSARLTDGSGSESRHDVAVSMTQQGRSGTGEASLDRRWLAAAAFAGHVFGLWLSSKVAELVVEHAPPRPPLPRPD
jgi:hypothetical protein